MFLCFPRIYQFKFFLTIAEFKTWVFSNHSNTYGAISETYEWLQSNGVLLTDSKTQSIIFSLRPRDIQNSHINK